MMSRITSSSTCSSSGYAMYSLNDVMPASTHAAIARSGTRSVNVMCSP